MTKPLRIIDKLNKFLTLGLKGIKLINQVGFNGSLEESRRDVNYRNDPTVEGVSNMFLFSFIAIIIIAHHTVVCCLC